MGETKKRLRQRGTKKFDCGRHQAWLLTLNSWHTFVFFLYEIGAHSLSCPLARARVGLRWFSVDFIPPPSRLMTSSFAKTNLFTIKCTSSRPCATSSLEYERILRSNWRARRSLRRTMVAISAPVSSKCSSSSTGRPSSSGNPFATSCLRPDRDLSSGSALCCSVRAENYRTRSSRPVSSCRPWLFVNLCCSGWAPSDASWPSCDPSFLDSCSKYWFCMPPWAGNSPARRSSRTFQFRPRSAWVPRLLL